MFRRIALASALLIAFGACSSEPQAQRPSSTASVKILTPAEGAVVTSPALVEIQLEGGRIVPRATTKLTPDTGHLHITVDGKLVSQTFGLKDTIDFEPGDHVMQVEYVAADHGKFVPTVISTASFTVE